jgi:hypothetical protein
VANANFLSGYGANNRQRDGKLPLDNGRFVSWGRATFPGTAASCTIPSSGGASKAVAMVLLHSGSASMTGLYYTANSDGSVTVTRTDSVNNGEFSFLVVYDG